jgi:glycosyltransferase involved in cell wall biosynthesis
MPVTRLVSVVIPAFNASKYIREAIGAAQRQTHPELEIIVVDDGSTDNTAEIVNAIPDGRIKYRHQCNSGQSSAINFGVRESNGAYIKLLDADDWIHPEHIASQMAAIRDSCDAVATCRWGYFTNNREAPDVRTEFTNKDYNDPIDWFVDSMTHDEGMMGGWLWLVPRSLWNKCGGYDNSLTLYNDIDFSVRLLLASHRVRFASGATYSYRRGVSTSMSVDRSARTMNSVFNALETSATLMLERRDTPEVRKVFADRMQYWVYQFYPQCKPLAQRAQDRIKELGGSNVVMGGGTLQAMLVPVIGWKAVRHLQRFVCRLGWHRVLEIKNRKRLSGIS